MTRDKVNCETGNGMISTGISKIYAADVTLCTSGLPQKIFWTTLGRPGGSSNQDGQAKTRFCRGSPENMNTQTHRISKPCLRRVPARHGLEQDNFEQDVQSSADDELQGLYAGTSQRQKDLQNATMEVTACYATDQQTPSTHRRGISQLSPRALNEPRAPQKSTLQPLTQWTGIREQQR